MCLPLMAQQRQSLHGKVEVNEAALPGAFIINKQTGEEVKAGADGTFTLAAKTGDKLIVYSNTTTVREFYITADTFKTMPYIMAVEVKAEQLEEVVIERPVITNEAFGLPENQRRMTVAERRLHTADSGPVDILLNWINGKKKMLKRELATEQKEAVMEGLNGLVNEDEFATKYNIPAEMVQGFLFYAIDQPNIVDAVNQNNESLLDMLLIETAAKYRALQEQPTTPNTQPATPNNEP